MFCFSLISDEIQIWGNKKRHECKHNNFFKNKQQWQNLLLYLERTKFCTISFERLKTISSQAKVEQGLCHLYGWFIGKPACQGLSPLSSLPLRTFPVSFLYLNSLAMSINTSIMAALRSVLQVISKNKTKRMNKEENNHNITFNMDCWTFLLCNKMSTSTPFKIAFPQNYNCFVLLNCWNLMV